MAEVKPQKCCGLNRLYYGQPQEFDTLHFHVYTKEGAEWSLVKQKGGVLRQQNISMYHQYTAETICQKERVREVAEKLKYEILKASYLQPHSWLIFKTPIHALDKVEECTRLKVTHLTLIGWSLILVA